LSLLTRGINKLSGLEIDVSKDWAGHLIKNIGPAIDSADALRKVDAILQAVMPTLREILSFRGDSGAERLAPDAGKGYNFLRSRGPGLSPVWQDIESLIQYMTAALNRAIAFDLALLMPAISQVSQQASSPPGRTASPMLSVPEPSVSIDTETGDGGGVVATPSLNIPVASVTKEVATGEPVGGAVADDGGVQTNETSAANNDTA
jgi:hypothetical protein